MLSLGVEANERAPEDAGSFAVDRKVTLVPAVVEEFLEPVQVVRTELRLELATARKHGVPGGIVVHACHLAPSRRRHQNGGSVRLHVRTRH